jgi:hypothetical protein
MTQTEVDYLVSLSLFPSCQRQRKKEQRVTLSALATGPASALDVALLRCIYPPHRFQKCTTLFQHPFSKGTSLLCRKGDISILH